MKRILEEKERLKIEIETVRKIQEIGMKLFILNLQTKRLNPQTRLVLIQEGRPDLRDIDVEVGSIQ